MATVVPFKSGGEGGLLTYPLAFIAYQAGSRPLPLIRTCPPPPYLSSLTEKEGKEKENKTQFAPRSRGPEQQLILLKFL